MALALTKQEFLDTLKTNSALLPPEFQKLLTEPDEERMGFLELESSYEFQEMDDAAREKEFNDLSRRLERVAIQDKQAALRARLKKAQQDHNDKEVAELLKEFSELMKKFDMLSK